MKNIYRITRCFLLCILLFSCSSQKKIEKINELTLINTAYEQGDVEVLIEALTKYPLHKGYVETFLYGYDFSKENYGSIKRYSLVAKDNVEATIFFDSLLFNKQAFIIDSLSNLSIEEVGDFYRKNSLEHDYLKDILREIYFADIQSLDYKNRKTLYNAFQDTDLKAEIETPYKDLRDSILSDIMMVLNPYFETERKLLKQIEYGIRYEAQEYLDTRIEIVVSAASEKNDRGLFEKIFQRKNIDRYSFQEYVNKVVNETYDYSYVEKLTKDRLAEYIVSANKLRSMFFCQYFPNNDFKDIYISDSVLTEQLIGIIGRKDIETIQNIKDVGTFLSVGSLALGFMSGVGTIAIAADVADFAYGLGQDGQINQAMEQMVNNIYRDSSISIDNYLANVFKKLTDSQQTTENNIRKTFYDEF